MSIPLHLLISAAPEDAAACIDALRRGGYAPRFRRIDSRGLAAALRHGPCDLILTDHRPAAFDAFDALAHAPDGGPPMIVVADPVGEETAASLIRRGAVDFVLKGHDERLIASVGETLRGDSGRSMPGARAKAARVHEPCDLDGRDLDARDLDSPDRNSRDRGPLKPDPLEHAPDGEGLQSSCAVHRSLVHSDLVGMAVWNSRDGITSANDAFLAIVGGSRDDLRSGKLPCDALIAPACPTLPGQTAAGVTDGATCRRCEQEYVRPDGSRVSVLVRAVPLEGTPGAWVALVLDTTEQRRAADGLLETNQTLRALVHSAPLAVVVHDRDDIVRVWNPLAERTFGWSAEEIVGLPLPLIFDADRDEARRFIAHILEGGRLFERELRLRRKDGLPVEVCASSAPVRDGQGDISGVMSICVDITERGRMADALKETNGRLEDALAELKKTQQHVIRQERLRALGQMASGIAHNINNTLVPILGFSDLLLTRPEILSDPGKSRRYLEQIHIAAHDIVDTVSRLREFYRNRDEIDAFRAVQLNDLIAQVVCMTQPRWKDQLLASGISIRVATDLQPLPPVAGNEGELREALTNLVFNAIDAMPSGGTLSISTRAEDGHVRVEVSDTGIGMTESEVEHCFEPFFTTKGEHGTGMGLSTLYGTIQRHAGDVEIRSRPGSGTTFVLCLPFCPIDERADLVEAAEPLARPLSILMIDDEPMVREVVREYLAEEGHRIDMAEDGRLGLEKFLTGRYDLVLTDKSMPGMTGDQLARAIKAVSPAQRVILLTGLGDLAGGAEDPPEGVDLVIHKPVRFSALNEAIVKVMASAAS